MPGNGWSSARTASAKCFGRVRRRTVNARDSSGRVVAERRTQAGHTIRAVDEERDDGSTAFVWTVIRVARA